MPPKKVDSILKYMGFTKKESIKLGFGLVQRVQNQWKVFETYNHKKVNPTPIFWTPLPPHPSEQLVHFLIFFWKPSSSRGRVCYQRGYPVLLHKHFFLVFMILSEFNLLHFREKSRSEAVTNYVCVTRHTCIHGKVVFQSSFHRVAARRSGLLRMLSSGSSSRPRRPIFIVHDGDIEEPSSWSDLIELDLRV